MNKIAGMMVYGDGSATLMDTTNKSLVVTARCGTLVRLTNTSLDTYLENVEVWSKLSSNAFLAPAIGSISGEGDVRFGSLRIITRPSTLSHRGRAMTVFIRSDHEAKRSYKTGVMSNLAVGFIYEIGDGPKLTAEEMFHLMAGTAFAVAHTHDMSFLKFVDKLTPKKDAA